MRHFFRGSLLASVLVAGLVSLAQDPTLHVNEVRLRQALEKLSAFGHDPKTGGTTRLGFSESDLAARQWVIERMREAGLEVWIDPAANIHGLRPGREPSLPRILFGSHIDSVINGGNFDGDVGSMGALEVIRALNENKITTRHSLEVVIWANEEGVHYGKGLFGSRAATRGPDPGELDARDDQDISLREWLKRYGGAPERIDDARLDPQKIKAYLELHIEQGGVLDQWRKRNGAADRPLIGIVEGIVGIDRFHAVIEGFANHAGTTPMADRRDALVAASQLTLAVRDAVRSFEGKQVGNVGYMKVFPGAPNVIPGRVEMPIELRDLSRERINAMSEKIRQRAKVIEQEERVKVSIERYATDEPALADPRLKALIEESAHSANFAFLYLPSGAGHDAQTFAHMRARDGRSAPVPLGMIFIPSINGISHSPLERSTWRDCANGAEVLYRTILRLDAQQ